MSNALVCFSLAFLTTIVFMIALRPLAVGIGLVDRPGGRKQHVGAVPITGGLAMFAGLLVGSLPLLPPTPRFPFFLAGVTLLVTVGVLDDRFDLPALARLLAQATAVLLMIVGADVVVLNLGDALGSGSGWLGGGSGIFTFLIVLTAINALNMFDGSDGVAGGQVLIGLVFLAFLSIMSGTLRQLDLVLCLTGCVLGFLAFNWPSRRTDAIRAFMGDAGSTMLGFSLAWLCVRFSQGENRMMSPIVALWIFALPLYDFFSSFVRRILSGRSPLHGDAAHLHHLLRRFGLNSRQVAQAILLAAAVLSGVGTAGYLLKIPDSVMFAGWLLVGVAYYLVFGSGLVMKRREQARADQELPSGTYPTLWRQRGSIGMPKTESDSKRDAA
jgi:UDP-GlcNAc:undecaprenyl-phosphate GlcNAc-1-phosphate transferase